MQLDNSVSPILLEIWLVTPHSHHRSYHLLVQIVQCSVYTRDTLDDEQQRTADGHSPPNVEYNEHERNDYREAGRHHNHPPYTQNTHYQQERWAYWQVAQMSMVVHQEGVSAVVAGFVVVPAVVVEVVAIELMLIVV